VSLKLRSREKALPSRPYSIPDPRGNLLFYELVDNIKLVFSAPWATDLTFALDTPVALEDRLADLRGRGEGNYKALSLP